MATKSSTISPRQQYEDNWTTAFGTPGNTAQSGSYIIRNGEWIPIDKTNASQLRKTDSVRIESQAMGCHPDEIPKFDKFYYEHGVNMKHRPDGIPIFATRSDKIKAMNARQMRDNDETRGGRSR